MRADARNDIYITSITYNNMRECAEVTYLDEVSVTTHTHARGCDTVYIEAYVTIDLGVRYA